MKKSLLFILAALMVTTAVSAKGVNDKLITFGPKIGLSVADVAMESAGSDLRAIGAKVTFTGGVFLEVRPLKFMSISLDVLYARTGATDKENVTTHGGEASVATNVKLDYLNAPLMLNFYVFKGLALKAGIQPGFLLSATNDMKINGESLGDEDMKESLKRTDWTLPVGISYTFDFGLMIDARYNIPLSNLTSESAVASGISVFKNRVFTLSAAWKF